MSVIQFNASALNADQVIQHFGISEDDKAMKMAIRCLYNIMKDELPHLEGSVAERAAEITQVTIAFMNEGNYHLEQSGENFFGDDEIDHTALKIAVFCGNYTPIVNELAQAANNISQDVFQKAQAFWEEATIYLAEPTHPQKYQKESLFLAHIIAWEKVSGMDEMLENPGMNAHRIKQTLNEDVPAILSFAQFQTTIGAGLKPRIQRFQQAAFVYGIAGLIEPDSSNAATPEKPGSHLRLV